MNLLELIPGIGGLVERLVPDPDKRLEFKNELAKLDLQRDIAGLQAAKGMMENKSRFVSGAIPSLIWLASLMLFNNHILLPWAAVAGYQIPSVVYPSEYWYLLGVIITGLFAKKTADKGLQLGSFKTAVNEPRKESDKRPAWLGGEDE